MPASTNPILSRAPFLRDTVLEALKTGEGENSAWTVRLRPVQLGILWSSVFLLMVTTFLIGLRVGKNRGTDEMAERSVQQLVRLPVAHAPNSQSESLEASRLPLGVSESAVESVAKNEALPSAGFAAQGATAMLDRTTTAAPVASAPGASPAATLAQPASEPQKANELRAKKPEVARAVASQPVKTPPVAPAKTESRAAAENDSTLTQKTKAGWYVQLAASNSEAEASKLVSKLKGRDLAPTVQKTRVKNVTYSRVLVGPYRTRSEAIESQQRIKSLGVAKGEPFLRYLAD